MPSKLNACNQSSNFIIVEVCKIAWESLVECNQHPWLRYSPLKIKVTRIKRPIINLDDLCEFIIIIHYQLLFIFICIIIIIIIIITNFQWSPLYSHDIPLEESYSKGQKKKTCSCQGSECFRSRSSLRCTCPGLYPRHGSLIATERWGRSLQEHPIGSQPNHHK